MHALNFSFQLEPDAFFIVVLMRVCIYFMFIFPLFLFFILFVGSWRVYVDRRASSNHIGVNVVCIDAVYKCCIKTSHCLNAQALTIAQT